MTRPAIDKRLERDPGDESIDVTGDLAKTGNSAVTQAFNSTPGDAFDAAIRLVLWLRRTDASVLHSELRMILESLLDANASLVIRAALGKNLLHLADLDERWYEDHLGRLRPRADDQVLAWCAAWSGYLSRLYPSRETLEGLREHYGLAIQRLVPMATEHSLAAQAIARPPDGRILVWLRHARRSAHHSLLLRRARTNVWPSVVVRTSRRR